MVDKIMVGMSTTDTLLQQILNKMNEQGTTLKEQCRKLSVVIDEMKNSKKEDKEEHVILRDYTISANSQHTSSSVSNTKHNRARLFMDVGFTPASSAGVRVDFVYKNTVMGKVLDVIVNNGAAGAASEPIDIAHMSGFSFLFFNRDTINDAVIKNVVIVLYNE